MNAKPGGRRPRASSRRRAIRLLPATLVAAALLLTVRIGELWQGVDIGPMTVAIAAGAEDASSGEAAEKPGDSQGADAQAAAPTSGPDSDGFGLLDLNERFTEEELAVLLDLSKRRGELVAREDEIEARSRLLDAAETRIDMRIAEMEALRASLEELVRQYDDQEKAELESVVKIYETMKAKDAARILEKLSLPVLMGIMEQMKERKTAAILADMDAERAREVTAELARRQEVDLSKMTRVSDR